MRYIDADLLQEDFKEDHGGKRSLMIDTQPTADVRENVRGEWVGGELGECSICGHKGCASDIWTGCNEKYYCPNCGAELVVE